MKAPHRRDISARQDVLGKELRQLFDDFTQEDMPEDLLKLAAQLQGAFEGGRPAASASGGSAPSASQPDPDGTPKSVGTSSDPEVA